MSDRHACSRPRARDERSKKQAAGFTIKSPVKSDRFSAPSGRQGILCRVRLPSCRARMYARSVAPGVAPLSLLLWPVCFLSKNGLAHHIVGCEITEPDSEAIASSPLNFPFANPDHRLAGVQPWADNRWRSRVMPVVRLTSAPLGHWTHRHAAVAPGERPVAGLKAQP